MALKRMGIKVSEDMHEWLQESSERRGLTMNAIVIFALENYYNQEMVIPQIKAMGELLEKQEEELRLVNERKGLE
jgi:hypothetical protein